MLYRVTSGDGWVELRLVGEERAGLLLSARPGASLLCDLSGPLPRALRAAFPSDPHSAPADQLASGRLTGTGVLADDLVAALRLETRTGAPRALLLQLFGSRGNLAIVDPDSRMLWSMYRPVHPILTRWPPEPTWTGPPAEAGRPHRGGGRVARRFRDLGLARLARQREDELLTRLTADLRRTIRQQRRLVDNLRGDLATAQAGDEVRRDAETLATYLHEWRPGLEKIELPDPRDGRMRTIALDPAHDGPSNLDRLFKRARRAERGRETIARRLAEGRERLAELLEAERGLLEAAGCERASPDAFVGEPDLPRLNALAAWREAHATLLGWSAQDEARALPARAEPARPFRRYLIEERWEVWIGRNSEENDQLTHRHAALRDLWFHAQGVAGSHTILRTGGRPENVPRRILAKVAALAALHSRARHAGIVPVLVTERRYVRKPRKAPPGTATCLRSESLFVEPGVPAGARSI
jgi:predicted ribosome quality control (RQC) complex YloA/Tae2 family protein